MGRKVEKLRKEGNKAKKRTTQNERTSTAAASTSAELSNTSASSQIVTEDVEENVVKKEIPGRKSASTAHPTSTQRTRSQFRSCKTPTNPTTQDEDPVMPDQIEILSQSTLHSSVSEDVKKSARNPLATTNSQRPARKAAAGVDALLQRIALEKISETQEDTDTADDGKNQLEEEEEDEQDWSLSDLDEELAEIVEKLKSSEGQSDKPSANKPVAKKSTNRKAGKSADISEDQDGKDVYSLYPIFEYSLDLNL
jgi:hypothetical protein